MRLIAWLPITVLVSGFICIAAAVAEGEADISLLLIFPVFSGSSWLFMLGTLLVVASFFIGFAILIIGEPDADLSRPVMMSPGVPQTPKKSVSYGGVVLVGPIPIAFGFSKNLAIFMLIVGIAIAAALLLSLFAL